MGLIIGTLCKGEKDHLDDDFKSDTQDILKKMNEFIEAEKDKKQKKLKQKEYNINKRTLKKLFH